MNTSKQVNVMVGLLMLFALATLLYWLWDPQRAEDAELRQQEVNAERGGELFGLNCRACHGLAGQGILESVRLPGVPLNIEANRPVSIGDVNAKQSRIHDTIVCGRVGTLMPPWSQAQLGPLNDFQIDQLVALITGTMPGFDPPADPNAVSEIGWEAAIEEANLLDSLDKELVQQASESVTVLTLNDVSELEASTEEEEMLLRIGGEWVEGLYAYEVVKIVEVREATNEIEVERGAFGTKATEHQTGTEVFAGPIIPPQSPQDPLTGEQGVPPCGQLPVAPATAGGAGQPERPATAQEVQSEFVEPTDGVIETDSQDNFFTLNNFAMKVGESVTIRLTNPGTQLHNLRIAGLDGGWNTGDFATAFLGNGEVGEFAFVLDAPATLVFRCDVHPTQMWGQITVSE